ncbi:WG repeat-containing protein [Xanthocytophaga agilis]|uniref:WG repeat-containing protein n=1 Tax=Xanthocytophaga agilis TaxID=3048010 RepID=A0AAE3QXW1_9BACT|nr:WG repeat-containing protein [Xanthocytophaga agilis]MDJ1500031.1 WG repeat-containing protein [Xanthocytophaga agilis]
MLRLFILLIAGALALGLLVSPTPLIIKPIKAGASLFPVKIDELWGFIDLQGELVIPAQFKQAGPFSEGLAPVRSQGRYGYIDVQGKYVIPPIYDYAVPFANGRAVVYKNEKKYLIDAAGRIYFEHSYKDWNFASEQYPNLFIVTTFTQKQGVIDITGKLVIDTIYYQIRKFSDGIAVVIGLEQTQSAQQKTRERYPFGVINTSGKIIVPYDKYRYIPQFYNGYSIVRLYNDSPKTKAGFEGIIDTTGKLRFVVPPTHTLSASPSFSENLTSIFIETEKTGHYAAGGIVNADGKILFMDPKFELILPFCNNRSFARINEQWFMIDSTGKKITQTPFRRILTDGFTENFALVETGQGITAIDTNGTILLTPKVVKYDQAYYKDSVLYLEKWHPDFRIGYWDLKTNTVVPASFKWVDYTKGFAQGLLRTGTEGRENYVNQTGKVVWQEKENRSNKSSSQHFNIDYMKSGYFYITKNPQPDERSEYEEIASSYTHPGDYFFTTNTFTMKVMPEAKAAFAKKYEGITLYIANTQSDPVFFELQDGRLSINLQALDEKGQWRDIEYLPKSRCGYSYHTIPLKGHNYWEFAIPQYEGEFKTLLRARLEYKHTEGQKNLEVMYSNTFEASINPAQFWRKQGHIPIGLVGLNEE